MATVKMTGASFEAIRCDCNKHAPNETMIFAQAKQVKSKDSEIYLVPSVILLDEHDAIRSPGAVWPTDKFQMWLYREMKSIGLAEGYRVLTIHPHPFQSIAKFSCIDWSTMEQDREIYKKAYNGYEFLWIVFSKNAETFEGCIVRPDEFVNIDQIVVYDSNLSIMSSTNKKPAEKYAPEYCSRMLLIPDWDQDFVSRQKIGIVGLGGLGASVLQTLVMLGIGDNADLVLVDHDLVEKSNLSRIPYATHCDIGKRKVHSALRYVKCARPFLKATAIKSPCYSAEAQEALSGCDAIIGCVDNELARASLNYLAASFMIPLLDMGAGVIIDEFGGKKMSMSSGQARLYIPGATPCLLCNMGLDHEDFDREVLKLKMDEDEKALLGKTGYMQNFLGTDTPEPSVYVLNAAVANMGMGFLTSYLLGSAVDYHALHYTMESMTLEKLHAKSQEVCPVCGNDSIIGTGKFFDIDSVAGNKTLPVPKEHGYA